MNSKDAVVNEQINPSNCDQQGFEWIQDIIFDPEAPEIANRDILEMLESGKYILGLPAINARESCFVGLYRKIAVEE